MNKLQLYGKSVLISGANSGIGKSVALLFANEGANIAIIYNSDDEESEETKNEILSLGRKCIIVKGDVNDNEFCEATAKYITEKLNGIDVLVNNAGTQFPCSDISDLKEENVRKTFDTNIIGMILLTKAVFPYLNTGACVINTTSATAYQGHEELLDYSATKGAVVSFTRSLALQSKDKNIRVNAVAPGPVTTPLTKETFGDEKENTDKPPFERNASTEEIASVYLFLSTPSSAQITGQVLHPNGGIIING
ncbi:SDR family oxidoreductase [Chryseobacterium sp.]|uniref:SDR family oxidoreductase n=1 Tax=Chryseobacterium sp. TaxID=1871047 RepID=UPI0028A2A8EE|nr:SDR family oxidoreductase [Chryseobacterium sp.]